VVEKRKLGGAAYEDGVMRSVLVMNGDGSEKAVAAFGYGFDEAGVGGVVTEELAQLEHVGAEDLGLNVGFGPEGFEKLIMRDEALGVLDQIAKNGEGTRSEAEAPIFPPETLVGQIKTEFAKGLHGGVRTSVDFPTPLLDSRITGSTTRPLSSKVS